MRISILVILFSAFSCSLFAQTDSTLAKPDSAKKSPIIVRKKQADTVAVKKPVKQAVVKDSARLALEAMPKIALRRALIFPGLGQIYNKQVWKLPFVYGGFVGIGLVFNFNHREYKELLTELQYRLANPDKTENPRLAPYNTNNIISVKDGYRRNRDLSIIAGVGFYALQAIDAYVKAKFARYDIDNDLSLRFSPALQANPYNASNTVPSLKITLSL